VSNGAGLGFWNYGDSGDLFHNNTASHALDVGFYDEFGNHTTYSGNNANHTGTGHGDGFESTCSTYNTWTKNMSVNNYDTGYDLYASDCSRGNGAQPLPLGSDHFNGAQAIVTWNLANNNGGDGFYTEKLDSSEGSDFTGSTVANNTATGNGGAGFDSYRTYISTWGPHNWSAGNGGEGFYFWAPAADTVVSNTGTMNHEDGFTFDGMDAGCNTTGPLGFCDPQTVNHNTGTHNAEFGFWAQHVTVSSSNLAAGNGTAPLNCVNVVCVSHLASVKPGGGFLKSHDPDVEQVQAAPAKPGKPHNNPHHQ
jgi:hypothetical protein